MLSAPVEVVLGALESARAGRFAEICELFRAAAASAGQSGGPQSGWDADLARQGPITSLGAPQGRLAGLQLAPLAAAEPIAPWEPTGCSSGSSPIWPRCVPRTRPPRVR